MRRIFGLLAVAMPLALAAVGPVAASSAAVVTVNPNNMNGWSCINDGTDATEPCNFVLGPDTPPLGIGSVQLTATTPSDRHMIATPAYNGTPLSSVSDLDYWTYQPGPTLAISLQFDVKYHTGDTAYGGRLVFEPYQNGAVTVGSGWQHWDAYGGTWWASKTSAAGSNGLCPQSAPCTWAEVLTNWPDAQIAGNLLLKAGGNWTGFTGNADALTVGTAGGGSTTYDFDPNLPAPTNKDQCKNGGWANYSDAGGTAFKNQGDCVSYVATSGHNPGNG
jgi:hypothetical protein